MRTLIVLLSLHSGWTSAQNGRGPQQDPNGRWDIRLAVPGEPGRDYPTLARIPRTSFSCSGREPGYYADVETNCQAFRVCTRGSTYGFQSFLCPNGTLFNQAVFVCDWWMDVNCEESQQFFNNNNEKFENLKLGPQLMKDIKKMLTHPMRNPYDKSTMKSNLIVMQDYKPPSGQLFPNGALIPGPERTPNNIFLPPKHIQQNFGQYAYNDLGFSASTANPQHILPYNNLLATQSNADVLQRQTSNGQFDNNIKIQTTPHSNIGNLISNGHVGQLTQTRNNFRNSQQVHRPAQPSNFGNQQVRQKQVSNVGPTNMLNTQNTFNRQKSQYRQSPQTNNNRYRFNSGKETEFGVSFSKQYTTNSNQDLKQPYTYKTTVPQFSNEVTNQAGNEAKQNLVSNDEVPSTVITKTLTFNRIVQESKVGPKSKITFKTWIVKPKAAKLQAASTPYTYDQPTQIPTKRLVSEANPYVYDKPSTTQASKLMSIPNEAYFYEKPTVAAKQIITEPEPTPYEYIKPTVAAKQIVTTPQEQPYVYNKPTVAAKQIITTPKEPPRFYLTPTQPTLSQLYITPSSPLPTKASTVYLAPTTYKPSANYYLPPSETPIILSRQYLSPNAIRPDQFQSAKLKASPTSPTPAIVATTKESVNNPSFTLTKHSRINANHNNLTFADILTKEKLDITVNDIVKDTSTILNTASPQFGQLRQESDYSDSDSVIQESAEKDEKVTTTQTKPPPLQKTPTLESKSGRLIANLSTDLEPPFESPNTQLNSNPLANLPFFKEPPEPTNTIERTVSLKISIPEKIAKKLFKSHNDSDFDKLEILNTGSSNYLVLSNNIVSSTNTPSFIPLGKLTLLKNSNVSDSQALVFSFLADSLNVAKEYSNIAQQQNNIIPPTPAQPSFQNVNGDELARITNQISQLTSSQFSGNTYNSNINSFLPAAQTTTSSANQYTGTTFANQNNFSNQRNQEQNFQNAQYNVIPSQQTNQGQFFTTQFRNGNNGYNTNLLNSNIQNQLYSGQLYQLPVPDVSSQIFNGQSSTVAANIQTSSNQQKLQQHHLEAADLEQIHNINTVNSNNLAHSTNGDIEIVKSQSIPLPSPAKLQVTPTSEPDYFSSQENPANSFFGNILSASNGISAQLQDKIVGTIPHPLEQNKYLTYKKDQSYYVYTKLNNDLPQNTQTTKSQIGSFNTGEQAAKLIQNNNIDNQVSFQFVPSVSYQLDNVNDQQKILNAFNIDEFGNPNERVKENGYQINNPNERNDEISTDVSYTVNHPVSAKQVDGGFQRINALYTGPSSYLAPQASVGKLELRKEVVRNNNFNSKIEQFDDQNNHKGY